MFPSGGDQFLDWGTKEKPSYTYHSNAGVYLFDTRLISLIPKNSFYDVTDLMNLIIKKNKKLVHEPILGYWIDIGSPSDFKNALELVKHFKWIKF